jgi:hypothetical protein
MCNGGLSVSPPIIVFSIPLATTPYEILALDLQHYMIALPSLEVLPEGA